MAPRLLAVAALVASGLIAYPTLAGAQVDQPRFELLVQPRSGGINDLYTATVRIETRSLTAPQSYTPPRFSGFNVTLGTPSRPRIVGRGANRRYIELRRYTLQPKRAGTLVVQPAQIRYNGRTYATKGAFVEVRNQAGGAKTTTADPTASGNIGAPGYVPPVPPEEDDMFLHAVVDKKSAYVGEQVTATWMVFTKGRLGQLSPQPLSLIDWWGETIYEPNRNFVFHQTKIGDVDYSVAIVSKRGLFPTKSGTLRLPLYRATASLAYSSTMRRWLTAPSVEVTVKPLPGGAPAGFDPSYVGVFQLEASIDGKKPKPGKPIEIAAGQAIVLRLKVTGQGAVPRTNAPVIRVPGFRFGKPRDKSTRSTTSGAQVSGERVYRYWTTARKSGSQQIAPIRLPYFNPGTGQYHTAETKPIALLIKPGKGGGLGLTSRSDRLGKQLRAIRTGSTLDSRTISRFHDTGWFWLLALLPPLGFIGLVVYQRVRRAMESDTPKSRQRRAKGKARKRFRTAANHLQAGNDRELFSELARLIYESLEHAVAQPVRSMTRPQLREFLAEQGFSAELTGRIDEAIERCDFARFAPAGTSSSEMSAALDSAEALVGDIRSAGRASTASDDEVSA